jgi:hypothetical protein
MSSQPLAVQAVQAAAPLPSKREQLLALTRSGLRLFVSVVPSLVGAGLLGAIKGLVVFGLMGLLAGALFVLLPRFLGLPQAPLWLEILGFLLPPLALSLSGGYILMVQRVTERLAHEVQERGLVRYLYAVIKPVLVQVGRRVQGKGTLSRAELSRAIEASVTERMQEVADPSDQAPPTLGKRMESFLMEHSRRVLGLLALRAALTAPDKSSAVHNVEDVGIERLEMALADTLEDLFFIQMLLALLAGLLVAGAPAVIRLLLP